MINIKANKWSLINYFDVWGNADDGYFVNNQCVEVDDLNITEDTTEKDILQYLESIGFLGSSDRRRVRLEDSGDMIEIYAVKGHYPLGCLMMNY